jgi:hypothetical protein
MSARPVKITFAQMRTSGVRGILIYCDDYHYSHSTAISADAWSDDVRLSDIEPRFVCTACGKRGRRCAAGFQFEYPEIDRRHGLPLTKGTLVGGQDLFPCTALPRPRASIQTLASIPLLQ